MATKRKEMMTSTMERPPDTKKKQHFSATFGSDKEALRQRLRFEKECLRKAKEQLHRAQQHSDQVAKRVEQTQAELLDRSEDEDDDDINKSLVLFECRGICDNILSFLDIPDLGHVAVVCQKWRFIVMEEDSLWQLIVLRKWLVVPPIVSNYRRYCKSLLLRSTPEQQLVYPHCENNQDNEEYYLIAEFPGLQESTPDGPKPIVKSIKLDESLMTDEDQNIYENPICSCGEWRCNNSIHNNAWVRFPINVETASFDLQQLYQRILFKVSILRSSDCKVALLLDPTSNGFTTMHDEDEHLEDILNFYGDQTLREIPNFEKTANGNLSFQVHGSVRSYEAYDEVIYHPEMGYTTTALRCCEDGNYGIHIKDLLIGFVIYQEENDKHHMAPPFQSKCVTEFLAMAGVEWN